MDITRKKSCQVKSTPLENSISMQFIEKEEFPAPIALETARGRALTAASMYSSTVTLFPKLYTLNCACLDATICGQISAQSAYQARQISQKRPVGHRDQKFFMALGVLRAHRLCSQPYKSVSTPPCMPRSPFHCRFQGRTSAAVLAHT